MNKYRLLAELWEIEAVLYFILGILVDKLEHIFWLAVIIWVIGGAVSLIGGVKFLSKAKKEEKQYES